jgi:putative flavoprotein involved in K+ transport
MQLNDQMYDLIIIGGGQAGLAAGYYAKAFQLKYTILESRHRIGQSWRERYDSLTLFSTRRLSGLPGMKFPGQPGGYPHKDEAADYLENYAKHFKFPIHLSADVQNISQTETSFSVRTTKEEYLARAVIIAAGGFQAANIPQLPGGLDESVVQLHSSQYRNPSTIPPGRVLVVGAGNSGAAIAAELAAEHAVDLSATRILRIHPRHGWRKAVPCILRWTGLIYAPYDSIIGSRLRRFGIPIIGTELKQPLTTGKVSLRPAVVRLSGKSAYFADGKQAQYQCVIWCTGFRPDLRCVKIPGAVAADGQPNHHFGVSPVAGLFYIGLHWQRSLASALMGGVAKDAKFIVSEAKKYLDTK